MDNLPQLIYITLSLIGLGMTISDHGKPKKGKENAWLSFVVMLVIWWLLYKGGFFNNLL